MFDDSKPTENDNRKNSGFRYEALDTAFLKFAGLPVAAGAAYYGGKFGLDKAGIANYLSAQDYINFGIRALTIVGPLYAILVFIANSITFNSLIKKYRVITYIILLLLLLAIGAMIYRESTYRSLDFISYVQLLALSLIASLVAVLVFKLESYLTIVFYLATPVCFYLHGSVQATKSLHFPIVQRVCTDKCTLVFNAIVLSNYIISSYKGTYTVIPMSDVHKIDIMTPDSKDYFETLAFMKGIKLKKRVEKAAIVQGRNANPTVE